MERLKEKSIFKEKICDAHVHFVPPALARHTDFFKGIWQDKKALEGYLDSLTAAHIVPPPLGIYRKIGWEKTVNIYNQALLTLKDKFPHKLYLCALLNPGQNRQKEKVSSLKARGFSSICFASSYEGKFWAEEIKPILKEAADCDMPVFIHPQIINPIGFERLKDPLLMPVLEYSFDLSAAVGVLMMSGILAEIRNLRLVVSSLGGVIPFLSDRFDGVYEMLRQRSLVKDLGHPPTSFLKKIWVDTAGVKSLNILNLAGDFFGRDRILFASDYPVGNWQKLKGFLESFSWRKQLTTLNFQTIFKQ